MAANSIQLLEIPRDGSLVAHISPITPTPIRRPEPAHEAHQRRHRYDSPSALESSSGYRIGTLTIDYQLRVFLQPNANPFQMLVVSGESPSI